MSKILIADDNKQITMILASYAKKEGYEVLIAYDGQQALDLFSLHKKDILERKGDKLMRTDLLERKNEIEVSEVDVTVVDEKVMKKRIYE